MTIFRIPWHTHFPDPNYIKNLERKTILLDVGTLLRGILFRESHSAKLIEAIELSPSANAVICPHIKDVSFYVLKKRPELIPQFTSGLLAYMRRGTIIEVPNGDPNILPSDVAFDPHDDDIVIATAISNKCSALATLDEKCAAHAGKVIEVISPSQSELNNFIPTTTTINVPIYAGARQGSLLMQVMPKPGSTNYTANGRRYILNASESLGVWLSEKSWRYEVGLPNESEPLFQFKEFPLDRAVFLGVSYDCNESQLIAGCYSLDGSPPQIKQISGKYLPTEIENFGILSRGEKNSFSGYWQGVLSTNKFIGIKAINFGLQNKFHFEALDPQRYKIPDAVFEPACILTPEHH